jgi:SapC
MIDPVLFAAPVALDRVQHRAQRLHTPTVRFDRTAGMNSLFVAAVEFIDAARDYPIVFIEAGQGDDGQREVAPVAVLGLTQGENLMLNADGSWAARYVPALLRGYPLGLARTDAQNYVVVIDGKAEALSATTGEPLFNDKGEPTPMLEERRKFLEQLENEARACSAAACSSSSCCSRCASTPRCPTASNSASKAFSPSTKRGSASLPKTSCRNCTRAASWR